MSVRLGEVCSRDVVIDTCVFAHSCQPESRFGRESVELLRWIREHDEVQLALDNTGKDAPNLNTSVLYKEYRDTLPPQSAALVLFSALLASGRVVFSSRPPESDRRVIRSLVPKNKRDQAVLGAAVTSADHLLVSNDERDFNDEVRTRAQRSLRVRIVRSDELLCA